MCLCFDGDHAVSVFLAALLPVIWTIGQTGRRFIKYGNEDMGMKKTEEDLEGREKGMEGDREVDPSGGSRADGKADSKGRILFLLELLRRETDEEHPLSTQEILGQVRAAGYSANRKTVRDDIDLLTGMGTDIIPVKTGHSNSFFIGAREFELAEVKLLIDAVSSARFIGPGKSGELIRRLSGLVSRHQAEGLGRRIYTNGRIKADNPSIYYTVDQIFCAIDGNRKVSFQYTEFDADRKKILRNNGERYTNSPYALEWNEDYYYLIGYSEKRERVLTFRVDRITKLRILKSERIPEPEGFSVADFMKKVFEMYDGEETEVTLLCENAVMKYLIDRFGEDIETERVSEDRFQAKVRVSASRTFYGWVFGFAGQIRITGPERARVEYEDMARVALEG